MLDHNYKTDLLTRLWATFKHALRIRLKKATQWSRRGHLTLEFVLVCAVISSPGTTVGALSKGHTILIERGLQVQGMVTKDDVFHLDVYEGANYTTINWLWQSNPAA